VEELRIQDGKGGRLYNSKSSAKDRDSGVGELGTRSLTKPLKGEGRQAITFTLQKMKHCQRRLHFSWSGRMGKKGEKLEWSCDRRTVAEYSQGKTILQV